MPTTIGPEIHKGDLGVKFILALVDQNGDAVDLSSGSPTAKIRFKSPDGVFTEKDATIESPASEGKISYAPTAVDAVFDTEAGADWKVQGFVDFGTDQKYNSSIVEFVVHENLEA